MAAGSSSGSGIISPANACSPAFGETRLANGGTQNAMFAGQMTDLSKTKIPCDNGPYRGGKGELFEGGTRVAACANWPGKIKPGPVDGIIHGVNEAVHGLSLDMARPVGEGGDAAAPFKERSLAVAIEAVVAGNLDLRNVRHLTGEHRVVCAAVVAVK